MHQIPKDNLLGTAMVDPLLVKRFKKNKHVAISFQMVPFFLISQTVLSFLCGLTVHIGPRPPKF